METWPELWVKDEVYLKAKPIIDELSKEHNGEVWHCPTCSEENEPIFEVCWSCQSENSYLIVEQARWLSPL